MLYLGYQPKHSQQGKPESKSKGVVRINTSNEHGN